jgi:dTDP-4-dehydrorhamnose reductase
MWLLVGGDSEIGSATHRFLRGQGLSVAATTRHRGAVASDRPFLDLSIPLDFWEPPPGTTAACLFAAAARIVTCDSDPEGSRLVNVTQTLVLVDKLLDRGIPILFLSTNQVFDGTVPNVAPDAAYSPTTEYGRQKVLTETTLRARIERGFPAAILRLAKVVSPDMPLLQNWINSLAKGEPIRAFSDMTMAPAETAMVSAVIAALMKDAARGIFQLTGPSDLSYFEIGCHIADKLGAKRALVNESKTDDVGLPTGSARMHTTLDSSRLRDGYGFAAPNTLKIVDALIHTSCSHRRQSTGLRGSDER